MWLACSAEPHWQSTVVVPVVGDLIAYV